MRINCIVSNRNVHERDAMQALADRYGIPAFEYTNFTPTYFGTGEVLPSQAREVMKRPPPYTGCNAGITHFHAGPRGKASICKVGWQEQIDLIAEGAEGLRKLAAIGDPDAVELAADTDKLMVMCSCSASSDAVY